MCGVVIDMSVGRDVSLTSRRSNDSEGDDSVIGGSGEPVKHQLIRCPPPRNRTMFMYVSCIGLGCYISQALFVVGDQSVM